MIRATFLDSGGGTPGWEMECPDCGADVSSGYFDPVCPICGGILMILSHPEPTFPELEEVIRLAESFLE